MRIGEASNPGPQSNARRVPGASQLSGGPTQATDSRDVRAVLRGVPSSDRTVVDVSGDSVRSGNRFGPLSEPSGESRRGDRRRRLVLVSQQEVPESDHEWDSDTDSIGGVSDVEVEPPVEDPIISEWRLRAPVRSFASMDGQQRSQDSERLEVALGASKNVALSASSRKHSSSQEVGGQAENSSKKVIGSPF